MNKLQTLILAAITALTAAAAPLTLTSPDGHLSLTAGEDHGVPYYTLSRDGKVVLAPAAWASRSATWTWRRA